MTAETGDKAITPAAGTDTQFSQPLDFTAVTTGSEQLFTRPPVSDTNLPAGMARSTDLLDRVQIASLDGNVIGRPDKPVSDAQLMLQLSDPEVKSQRDQFLNDPTKISEALKRIAENPNDPSNRKTETALKILRLDLQNQGFTTTLDLKKGELSLTKPDLDTGESQSLKFDRNGTDRDLKEFMARTIEPPIPDITPTVEMNRRESRINASLELNNINPLLNAVKDLQQTVDKMGDRDSPILQNRIDQLVNMLEKVGNRLSGDNPFHPVKAGLTQDGKFELSLSGNDKLSISPDGTIEINGRSVKPDSKEVKDFLALGTKLRRLTTNELA